MDNTELYLIPLNVTPAESDVAALERKRAALADDPDRFRFINPSLRVSFARRRPIYGYPSSLIPGSLVEEILGQPKAAP